MLVLIVSEGMEMESTGGGLCDLVEAMVELVSEGELYWMDLALE